MASNKTTERTPDQRPVSKTAIGLTLFAATMLMIGGFFQVMQGLIALFNDTFFVVGQEWTFEFDITGWGWIHLIMGAVLIVAGAFVLRGVVWARVAGIAVAALSAVLNFMWLPYYPVWSILIIAVDVLVIWALTAHGRDITR